MGKRAEQVAELSCRILMLPIARFLLTTGMSFGQFVDIAKRAYVTAALDSSNADKSISSIAAKTGIARKEIARIKDETSPAVAEIARELSLPAAILTRWHQDPEFVLKDGRPKSISLREFETLTGLVDEAIDADEMLKELLKSNSIERTAEGSFVPIKRYFIPRREDPRRILRFGIRIADLANTLESNASSNEPVIEASAYNPSIALEHLPILRQIARVQASSLLQSLDDWLTSHAAATNEPGVRAGLGVYFFEDPSERDSVSDS